LNICNFLHLSPQKTGESVKDAQKLWFVNPQKKTHFACLCADDDCVEYAVSWRSHVVALIRA